MSCGRLTPSLALAAEPDGAAADLQRLSRPLVRATLRFRITTIMVALRFVRMLGIVDPP